MLCIGVKTDEARTSRFSVDIRYAKFGKQEQRDRAPLHFPDYQFFGIILSDIVSY
jgi:hypothetical protein